MAPVASADVVGTYADQLRDKRLDVRADGRFTYTDENSGFNGRQGSHERGTWELVRGDLVELHVREIESYYEDTNDWDRGVAQADRRRQLSILRDARGRIRALVNGETELQREDWTPPGWRGLVTRVQTWWRRR